MLPEESIWDIDEETMAEAANVEILRTRLKVQAHYIADLETAHAARRALSDELRAENTELRDILRRLVGEPGDPLYVNIESIEVAFEEARVALAAGPAQVAGGRDK